MQKNRGDVKIRRANEGSTRFRQGRGAPHLGHAPSATSQGAHGRLAPIQNLPLPNLQGAHARNSSMHNQSSYYSQGPGNRGGHQRSETAGAAQQQPYVSHGRQSTEQGNLIRAIINNPGNYLNDFRNLRKNRAHLTRQQARTPYSNQPRQDAPSSHFGQRGQSVTSALDKDQEAPIPGHRRTQTTAQSRQGR